MAQSPARDSTIRALMAESRFGTRGRDDDRDHSRADVGAGSHTRSRRRRGRCARRRPRGAPGRAADARCRKRGRPGPSIRHRSGRKWRRAGGRQWQSRRLRARLRAPACGGWRRAAADAIIDGLEAMDGGWYAGAVGWIDAHGDGEFAVALRCGLLWEDGARLYAGVGVMPDSDAARELEETELKFKALLTALT